MPSAAMRFCAADPKCPNKTTGGPCSVHKQARQERADRLRGTAQERGYDYRWSQASKAHLAVYPLCGMRAPGASSEGWRGECVDTGRLTPADVTDHIQPHKGDMALFWSAENWQSLCRRCNSAKAARFEGGFGR